MRGRTGVMLLAAAGLAGGAAAQERGDEGRAVTPASVTRVFECRAIREDAARLACFDASVAALEMARSKGDVAVVDREDVRRTRRKLFGFSIPDFGIFGGKKDERGQEEEDKEEVKEITAKIAAVGRGTEGFVITLADGARWAQTDGVTLGRSPRVGEDVTIKRGTFGSYKMSFKTGPAVKARRVG